MKQMRFLIPSFSVILLLYSCTKDKGDANNGGTTPTQGPLFVAVKSVMSSSCAFSGCHAGSSPASGLDFSNDNNVVAQKARIKVRAVDEAGTANQMPQPPRAALSAADQKKITDWMAAGGRLTD